MDCVMHSEQVSKTVHCIYIYYAFHRSCVQELELDGNAENPSRTTLRFFEYPTPDDDHR